ncbi:LysR family transcriptional regulator [Labrys wisconsinensis]|uniref:DNA-binding transcriptional LysR family regulator n=1 Tax=Labrys wisconsinensis TaxID=425677 RepID=A0ABU0JAG7_9HYPH|nr:LysR family transcriptional regulator [Labrys wisconsinensis]MDQ0471265.1 DNA-binding transcriptional LysR family regulator [Labrys wisconsinensis]
MRLDIDSLRAFLMVLELGGVTRAAHKLNLTQSAVSHKLTRLEERIGRPILLKGSHGFVPTSDGRSLLSYAERLIALHDEAAAHFRSSELAGEVRLGATEDAACEWLATVLGRFRRLHPRVSLGIRVAQSLVLEQWLRTGEVDLAMMQVFVHDKRPGDLELWREDLIWVQSTDHPLTLGTSIPFVSFDVNCFYRRAAQDALRAAGRSLDIVLECPSCDGVIAGARHGLGVAVIGRRHLGPGLMEIEGGLPAFPQICHIARSGKRLARDLESTLMEAVSEEMIGEPQDRGT